MKSGENKYKCKKAQYRPTWRLDLTHNLEVFCLSDAFKNLHNQWISLLLGKRRSLKPSAVSKVRANSKQVSGSFSEQPDFLKTLLSHASLLEKTASLLTMRVFALSFSAGSDVARVLTSRWRWPAAAQQVTSLHISISSRALSCLGCPDIWAFQELRANSTFCLEPSLSLLQISCSVLFVCFFLQIVKAIG